MSQTTTIRLGELAHARSGDKGAHANIGVIAYTPAAYDHLRATLTAQLVEKYFQSLKPSRVDRFELPGIYALNFLLHDVLGGGASLSLRTDSQGKTLALALLEMQLDAPLGSERQGVNARE